MDGNATGNQYMPFGSVADAVAYYENKLREIRQEHALEKAVLADRVLVLAGKYSDTVDKYVELKLATP